MVFRGCLGCILCQKRLRLSRKVEECEPLPQGSEARGQAGRRLHPGAYTRPLFRST